jgi:hypothetical protein
MKTPQRRSPFGTGFGRLPQRFQGLAIGGLDDGGKGESFGKNPR